MKYTFFILAILFLFVQTDFAQKKFVAYEMTIYKGINGKSYSVDYTFIISPDKFVVYDKGDVRFIYTAVEGSFGMGKGRVRGYNTGKGYYCYVTMYKGSDGPTLVIDEDSRHIFFKGTYYF